MGNAYVAGIDNAFRITPDGVITQIIDRTGDGIGHSLVGASSIVPSDATGDVYVSGSGFGGSNNVFQITPAGLITQVLDASGDGMGQGLIFPLTLAVDASGTLFVAGLFSSNVFRGDTGIGLLGENYCMAVPSSSGGTGAIAAFGRGFVRASDVTLTASDLPTQAFGYFITSRTQGFVAHPSGSAGNLCILGSIGRCVGLGQVQDTGSSSSFSLRLDLAMTPTPTGLVSVSVGETWTFQAWHRDTLTGAPTSNFSDAIEISLY